jgi:triosephosphate isomerase
MKKLIVANWKMHFNTHETELFIHKLNKIEVPANIETVICPPFIGLQVAAKSLDAKKFKLGAQDAHQTDEGAFTGEVSAAMLRGLVDYVIVGHSERRRYFGEKDNLIADKMAAAVRNGIKPILCVGESLDDRHHELSMRVVIDQVTANLKHLTALEVESIAIAYEPVWAIGTGEIATPEQIAPVIQAIRHTVEELYGEEAGSSLRVLYGGSVEAESTRSILNISGINGLLVGGASLIATKFSEIIKAAN